jgi:hypothetical protein
LKPGEIDDTGRIGKVGDGSLRTALYGAGHIILTKPLKGCSQLERREQGQGGARPPTGGGDVFPSLTSVRHPVGDVTHDKSTVGASSWSGTAAR